jgi:hypothetical protein
MARDLSAYREVALQSVPDEAGRLVLRPMSGQAFAPVLRVHGGARLAAAHPAGTCFLVQAKLTDRQGGAPFLYLWHADPVRVVSLGEARRYLAEYRRLRL